MFIFSFSIARRLRYISTSPGAAVLLQVVTVTSLLLIVAVFLLEKVISLVNMGVMALSLACLTGVLTLAYLKTGHLERDDSPTHLTVPQL